MATAGRPADPRPSKAGPSGRKRHRLPSCDAGLDHGAVPSSRDADWRAVKPQTGIRHHHPYAGMRLHQTLFASTPTPRTACGEIVDRQNDIALPDGR